MERKKFLKKLIASAMTVMLAVSGMPMSAAAKGISNEYKVISERENDGSLDISAKQTEKDMYTPEEFTADADKLMAEDSTADSGTCGENLTWDYDGVGKLTISGSGEMEAYNYSNHVPWYVYRESIKNVELSDGVTSIGDEAFSGCSGLKGITIPDGVTLIGDSAFEGCSGLTSITIPKGVTSIGNYAFMSCISLKGITIPNGVMSIESGAFMSCISLKGITIPEGVKSIGSFAFGCCFDLTEITIPDGVTSIGDSAFWGCGDLTDVYYSGTEKQWKAIEIGSENGRLTSATIHFNAAGLPSATPEPTVTPIIKPTAVPTEMPTPMPTSEPTQIPTSAPTVTPGATSPTEPTSIPPTAPPKPDIEPTAPPTPSPDASIESFMERVYKYVFNREIDSAGFDYWVSKLTAGGFDGTGVFVGYSFIFSPEFRDRGYSDKEFIDILYITFMGRDADIPGEEYWISNLEGGFGREYVFTCFMNTDEYRKICDDAGITFGNPYDYGEIKEACEAYRNQNGNISKYVTRCYTKVLGRAFEDDGVEFWCGQIITGNCKAVDAARSFVFSDEFKNKNKQDNEYIEVLYQMFFDRAGDDKGIEYWLSQLTSGAKTRETILDDFSYSDEFAGVLAGFGL